MSYNQATEDRALELVADAIDAMRAESIPPQMIAWALTKATVRWYLTGMSPNKALETFHKVVDAEVVQQWRTDSEKAKH